MSVILFDKINVTMNTLKKLPKKTKKYHVLCIAYIVVICYNVHKDIAGRFILKYFLTNKERCLGFFGKSKNTSRIKNVFFSACLKK